MKIAVVGGIGSGKSEVMKAVQGMNVATCVSADEINAELLKQKAYVEKLKELFPSVVKGGVVDKKALAKIVFNDEKARKALNNLAHPLIVKSIKQDLRDPLVVEVPLILETDLQKFFDTIVFVGAPLDKRIERLVINRGMSEEDALARINAQADVDAYRSVANFVIINDGTVEELHAKAHELFDFLLNII